MTEERTAEDVYELVEELGGKIEEMVDLRERVGGDVEIMARIAEHEQLMIDVPQIKESQERMEVTIDVLADKMIGEKIPDPLRPGEFLTNGRGEPMRKARPVWPRWIGQAVVQGIGVVTALLIFLAATA